MENIKSHKNMKLATSQEKYTKYVMKPDFTDGYPFRKFFCSRDRKKQDQDEQINENWRGSIGFKLDINV